MFLRMKQASEWKRRKNIWRKIKSDDPFGKFKYCFFFVLLQVIFDMEFPGKKVVKISLKLHNLQKHYSEWAFKFYYK